MSVSGRRNSKSFVLIISALAVALLAGLAATGCGSSVPASADDQVNTGPLTITSKGPVNKEGIQATLDRQLGDAGIAGQPVTRSITLTPEAGGVFVDIQLNRTASCHPGQLVGTVVDITKHVMSSTFRYSDVSRVQISLYGPTELVQDKDKLAARVMVTKEQSTKIDWAAFTDQNAAQLSSEYWIEPSIYENWKKYGSAAITDPAQRAAANAGTPGAATTPTP